MITWLPPHQMREAKKSNTWKHTELGPPTNQAGASQWNYRLTLDCYTLFLPSKCHFLPWGERPLCFLLASSRSLDSSSVSRAGPLLLSSNKCLLEADCFYHFWEQDTKPIFAPVKLQSSFPQPLVWRVDIDIMHTHGHIQGTLSSATLCNGLITVFSCFICRFFILYMLLQSYFDRTNNNPLQLNLCIAKIINFAFPGMTTAIVNFKGVLDC